MPPSAQVSKHVVPIKGRTRRSGRPTPVVFVVQSIIIDVLGQARLTRADRAATYLYVLETKVI